MTDGSRRYLHVGFHNFVMTDQLRVALENTFNGAANWARYAPNCWILWTSLSVSEWERKIAQTPGLPSNYGALILTVDPSEEGRGGMTYEWLWRWLKGEGR